MTDFLIISGFSLDTINELKENDNLLSELYDNREEVIQITNYFRMIGVKNIEDIMLYKPQLFLETKDDLIYSFSKFNISDIVAKINNDYTNIDIVYNAR